MCAQIFSLKMNYLFDIYWNISGEKYNMLFTSFVFLQIFLPVVMLTNICLRKIKNKNIFLLWSAPHVIYFGNLTEVIIVPEKSECRIVHEHFNRKHGHAFKVPYSIATVHFTDKKFIISDKEVGNLAIQIDGKNILWGNPPPLFMHNTAYYGLLKISRKVPIVLFLIRPGCFLWKARFRT